jgi:hypothetical protein
MSPAVLVRLCADRPHYPVAPPAALAPAAGELQVLLLLLLLLLLHAPLLAAHPLSAPPAPDSLYCCLLAAPRLSYAQADSNYVPLCLLLLGLLLLLLLLAPLLLLLRHPQLVAP